MRSSVIYHRFLFVMNMCVAVCLSVCECVSACPKAQDILLFAAFTYVAFVAIAAIVFVVLLLLLLLLASNTRKLKLLFHLESTTEKIYGHPGTSQAPYPRPLSLRDSLSLSVSFAYCGFSLLCHFYAHYFAFAAALATVFLRFQNIQQQQSEFSIFLLLFFAEVILISIYLLFCSSTALSAVCSRLFAYLLHFVL